MNRFWSTDDPSHMAMANRDDLRISLTKRFSLAIAGAATAANR